MVRPFLKWAGGKTQLLPEILPRLPEKIATYHEPFVGGGAVFFALAEARRFERAVLYDTNTDLINLYSVLRDRPRDLILQLGHLARTHSEEQFYKVREAFNTDRTGGTVGFRVARAVGLLYLNKTCFNGLYRVSQKGDFNVSFGDYKDPTICDEENLRAASRRLQGVELKVQSFEDTCKDIFMYAEHTHDAVYFDPPYMPVSKTSNFTAYSGAFGLDQHRELSQWFRKLSFRKLRGGLNTLLSNSDTPDTRALYEGLLVETVQARRSINSKGTKRGSISELLISGKKAP